MSEESAAAATIDIAALEKQAHKLGIAAKNAQAKETAALIALALAREKLGLPAAPASKSEAKEAKTAKPKNKKREEAPSSSGEVASTPAPAKKSREEKKAEAKANLPPSKKQVAKEKKEKQASNPTGAVAAKGGDASAGFECKGNLITGDPCATPDAEPASQTKDENKVKHDTCVTCKKVMRNAKTKARREEKKQSQSQDA